MSVYRHLRCSGNNLAKWPAKAWAPRDRCADLRSTLALNLDFAVLANLAKGKTLMCTDCVELKRRPTYPQVALVLFLARGPPRPRAFPIPSLMCIQRAAVDAAIGYERSDDRKPAACASSSLQNQRSPRSVRTRLLS